MGEVVRYSLTLNCDHASPTCPEQGNAKFVGLNRQEAIEQAFGRGWRLREKGARVIAGHLPAWVCPSCRRLEPETGENDETG